MYATSGANIKCDITTFALSLKNAFRSGLRESLRRRRLANSGDCPDCKGVTDTPEHVLTSCPVFDAERRICVAALGRCGCELNLQTGLGGVEELRPHQQLAALKATAGLLKAIDRIGARRRRGG
jgi:hypothetical protein